MSVRIEASDNESELYDTLDEMLAEDSKKRNVDVKFRSFAYFVKDDSGKILGGITGHRMFEEIYVSGLCLDESARGLGLGRKLLEIVERDINDGTCENINLITNAYQGAVDFYKKCGFEVEFIRKHKNNEKFNRYYMVKKTRLIQ
jgi:ribosomal protein S18 acetylase RimI-like enzyme